jgi:hypothetical protein
VARQRDGSHRRRLAHEAPDEAGALRGELGNACVGVQEGNRWRRRRRRRRRRR